jgi:prepilin-type N-terminal cleavage/methylation domain-containing protein
MKKKKPKINRKRKTSQGFTLIEILIVVVIISILVSVVLVSLFSARNKAEDNSVFSSLKSVAAPAFTCLSSGISDVRLTDPNAGGGNNICYPPTIISDSTWPDPARYGYAFHWCNINTSDLTAPPTSIGAYQDGVMGGDRAAGNFCFMMQEGSKTIWCVLNGCRKSGF